MIEEIKYTTEELRSEVVSYIKMLTHYWDNVPNKTSLEKLDGLAFSILVMLDGGSSLPPFAVRPIDENGKEGDDIAGGLHDAFCQTK